jgi:copper(I)-binding protein
MALLVLMLPGQWAARADEPGPKSEFESRLGDLVVAQAWSRPTPPVAGVGVVYFSITNTGRVADQLMDISSPVARQVEIHETRKEGGVVEMRAVEFVQCEPGATVKSEPGGLHVMLMGLTQPLVAGARFPMSLHFRRAGVLKVQVKVSARE